MKTGTSTIKTALSLFMATITLALTLAGCGGGGSGGGGSTVFGLNGGSVSGSVTASAPTQTYKFDVVADTAYTVSTVSTQGTIWLTVKDAAGAYIGTSTNSLTTTPYNNVSFIAGSTGTVTVTVQNMSLSSTSGTYTLDPASYTLQASDGKLTVGSTRTDSTYNKSVYYSFDATANTAYQVRLTPQSGNVNIGSVNVKLTASVGNSLLSGTEMDTVLFLAPATQRYYVRVDATSADTKFGVSVVAASTNPDLRAVVNSAISDGTDVTVNYTVYNQGLSATATSFGVDAWSNLTSAPAAGTSAQVAAVTKPALAAGASVTGSFVIPDTGASGTAYVIVDKASAVTEGDETNNVSAGKTWLRPLPAAQNITFEDGIVPTAMTMSGNANWAIDSSTGGASSSKSLKAGTIANSQSSCVAMSVSNGDSISFDYAVGSQQYSNYLYFYIDGIQNYNIYSASGTVPWTNSGTIAVTSGTHEYKWCYVKSSYSSSTAPDTAWIDNIVVTQARPNLSVWISSAVTDGSTVTVNYTAYNSGKAASGAFDVDFWSHSSSAPVVGTASQGTVTLPSLTAGSSTTGSFNIPFSITGTSGTAYAIVDNSNAVIESDENNNVSSGGYGSSWYSGVNLTVAVNSAVSDKTNVTVNYTVTNGGSSASAPFNVDIWSDSASTPTVGSNGQSTVQIPTLAGGASHTGSVTIANTSVTGTAYAIVDTTNAVVETSETNNVSTGVVWVQPVAAPWSYNITGATTLPTSFALFSTPTGLAPWAYYYNGLNGANARYGIKAGAILPGESTCIAVSATNSSSVTFNYSVGSHFRDYLQFYIDGVQQGAGWSGAIAFWATSSTYTFTTGQHEFKWCFVRSTYSSSVPPDTAYINNIMIN
jgi:hypothetical protein